MAASNDPRVLRTKQLLRDSFTSLILEKDFNSINVSDVTKKAIVNSATFYAHFTDKFDLLDSTITNTFIEKIYERVKDQQVFNQEAFKSIFLDVCLYHQELSSLCEKSYHSLGPIIEKKVKDELHHLIYNLLMKSNISRDEHLLKTMATMLSWSIFGTAYTWNMEGRVIPADELVTKMLPIFTHGMEEYLHK